MRPPPIVRLWSRSIVAKARLDANPGVEKTIVIQKSGSGDYSL